MSTVKQPTYTQWSKNPIAAMLVLLTAITIFFVVQNVLITQKNAKDAEASCQRHIKFLEENNRMLQQKVHDLSIGAKDILLQNSRLQDALNIQTK